jgi:large subunit ribosomal protein L9
MKVLLRQDIDKVGKRGEIVEVADGYARNCLLPQQRAAKATAENIRRLEAEHREIERRAKAERDQLKELAARLETVSCTLTAAANETGTLYAAVSAEDIVKALRESESIELKPECLVLEEPIKEVGVYTVPVRLLPDLETTLRVWIVAE